MTAMIEDVMILFFNLLIFAQMITLKDHTRRKMIELAVGCAVFFTAYGISVYVLHFPMVLSSLLTMSLPSLALFWLFSAFRDARFFLSFALADTLAMITASFSKYLSLFFPQGEIFFLGLTLLLFIALLVFANPYFRQLKTLMRQVEDGWTSMAVTAMLIYFVLGFIAAYPTPIAQRREYVPIFMAVCLLTFAFYLVVLHSLQKTQKIVQQNIQLQEEQKIYHIAYTDALTGLGNRAAYLERINQLERLRKNGISICCIELDMNGLKQVNDTLGHAAGDKALREIAAALKTVFLCRQPDSVFRVGGDEFCVLLSDVEEDEAAAYLNQLENQLKQSSQMLGFSLAAAAGMARVQPEESIETTMIRADDQMYKHKRENQKFSEKENETISLL